MIAFIRFFTICIYIYIWLPHFFLCHTFPKTGHLGFLQGQNTNFHHSNCNRNEGRRKAELFSKIDIKMPALSSTMTSGKIVKWNKEIGDYINVGDIIMTVESDKADMDVEAFDEGYLRKKSLGDGTEAGVGDLLGIMTTEKDEPYDDNNTETSYVASTTSDVDTSVEATPIHKKETEAKTEQVLSYEEKVAEKDVQYVNVHMPHIESENNKAKINKWLKKENEHVRANDTLFYAEADKGIVEVESKHDGILKQILVQEGNFVDFGTAVATLEVTRREETTNNEDNIKYLRKIEEPERITEQNILNHYKNILNTSTSGKELLKNLTESEKQMLEERLKINFEKYNHASGHGFIHTDTTDMINKQSGYRETQRHVYQIILPSAAELMKQHKINPSDIKDTKTPNRITFEDVEQYLNGKTQKKKQSEITATQSSSGTGQKLEKTSSTINEPTDRVVELSNIQKSIKNNMMLTLNVPVFRVTHLIKTNELLKLYNQIKDKINMTVILNKCIATVLMKHPLMYSTYIEEGNGKIVYHENVNIGNALGLNNSLLTPVLKNVNKENIYALADTWKELVKKGKNGTLTASEMSDSNFYISNLGMFNTYQFDAILPKNASCILSVGTNISSIENYDELKIKKGMMMTLTCDHRHIYGSHAAAFMSDLSQFIENNIMDIFL